MNFLSRPSVKNKENETYEQLLQTEQELKTEYSPDSIKGDFQRDERIP